MPSFLGLHGIASVVMNYYRQIDRSKVQFDFIVSSQEKGAYEDEVLALGGKIYRLPSRNRHPFKYVKALKLLFKENPEYKIFHVHGNSASIRMDLKAARKANIPFRIGHSHNTSCFIKWQHYFNKPFLNKHCTHFFACSSDAGKWMFGEKLNVKLVKNAIDLNKFKFDPNSRTEIRGLFNIQDDTVVAGTVGGLTPNKNQTFLLDVFFEYLKVNDNAKLIIVGKGGLLKELENKTKLLGIEDKVIFAGSTNTPNKFYSAFDIFCFPSLYEGLGLVAIEAAANGLNVLLSDRIPAEVNVSGRVRFLPLGNPANWSHCIENQLIKSEQRICEKNIEEIEQSGYNIITAAKELENFYLSL